MTLLSRFSGGVHPQANKVSADNFIDSYCLPKYLYIPIQQGKVPTNNIFVKPGQRVLKGQLMAMSDDIGGVAVHASSSGTLVSIDEIAMPDSLTGELPCFVLELDYKDEWQILEPQTSYDKLAPHLLLNHLRHSGIVGLGGAGFPTTLKLSAAYQSGINTLIINGAECEPYISADHALMLYKTEQLLDGVRILSHILEPKSVVIAIEDNKPDAINLLRSLTKADPIDVLSVPTVYPTGGEKQLIKIVANQSLRRESRPIDVGILCVNVGTVAAVADYILYGKPCLERIMSVAGVINKPVNLRVLVGTPINEVLSYLGIAEALMDSVVVGGPFMGNHIPVASAPVLKTTNCLIVGGVKNEHRESCEEPCIRCGACADVCPVNLQPQELFRLSKVNLVEQTEHYKVMDCIECGCCDYVCPSNISLAYQFKYAKQQVVKAKSDREQAVNAKTRHELKSNRLKRQVKQKALRRKAAAEKNQLKAELQGVNDKKVHLADAISKAKEKKQKRLTTQVE